MFQSLVYVTVCIAPSSLPILVWLRSLRARYLYRMEQTLLVVTQEVRGDTHKKHQMQKYYKGRKIILKAIRE